MRFRRHIPAASQWKWTWPSLGPNGVRRWALALAGAVLAGYLTAYLVVFPSPIWRSRQVVPRVLGLALEDASRQLREAGFQIQDGGSEPHPTAPQGTVIWQDPPPGVSAPAGVGGSLVAGRGATDKSGSSRSVPRREPSPRRGRSWTSWSPGARNNDERTRRRHPHRAERPLGRPRPARRAGAAGGGGRGGLAARGRDGRALRAEPHVRRRNDRGAAEAHGQAPRRAPHGGRAGALHRALRGGRAPWVHIVPPDGDAP